MRMCPPVLCGLLVWAASSCTSSGPTRAPARAPASAPPSIEERVGALEASSRPGPMHQRLSALVGDWELVSSQVGADGGETPSGVEGRAKLEWILDGRYLRWDSSARIAGAERTTHGWLGYDLRTREYQLSMITSFSTGMGIWRGSGDLGRDGLVFTLEQVDPANGSRMRARNRLRLVAPDHFVTEDLDGDGRVMTRTHYRRVHGGGASRR